MKRARNEKEEPAARAKRKREEEEYHSLVTWGLDIEQQLEEEIVEGSGYDQLTLPTLPRDVLLRVLSYLGVSDLCSVAVACKALRGAANDGELWSALFVRRFVPTEPRSDSIDYKALYRQREEQERQEFLAQLPDDSVDVAESRLSMWAAVNKARREMARPVNEFAFVEKWQQEHPEVAGYLSSASSSSSSSSSSSPSPYYSPPGDLSPGAYSPSPSSPFPYNGNSSSSGSGREDHALVCSGAVGCTYFTDPSMPDLYICERTGWVHYCNAMSCAEMCRERRLPACPISGRVWRAGRAVEDEPNSDDETADPPGYLAQAYLTGYYTRGCIEGADFAEVLFSNRRGKY